MTTANLLKRALSEVVVTALRSRTDLQKAAAAITVLDGQTLKQQRVEDIRGIQNLVPGIHINPDVTATQIFIRGAGSPVDFYWIPEQVAVNYDGVYLPRFEVLGAFYDIDNVQVLPGPQGVLYGHSASGGAILIKSNSPVLHPETDLSVDYGSHNYFHVEGVENQPISDDLSIRAAINYLRHDGYESLGADSENSISGRLSALYKPSAGTSVELWASYYGNTGTPPIAVYRPYINSSNPWYVPRVDPLTGLDNTGSFLDYNYEMVGANASADLRFADLSYTASFLNQTEHSLVKIAGNDQGNNNAQKQYSQDLKLSNGSHSRLQWIVGVDLLYTQSNADLQFGDVYNSDFPTLDQLSASGFGQLTYSVTEALRLVGGLRYSYDSLDAHGAVTPCYCSNAEIKYSKGWNETAFKGGIEDDVTPHSMVYANVQTGFAPGTFNTLNTTEQAYLGIGQGVKPQTQFAYTVGEKTKIDDGRLTLNFEGYLYDYRDFIIQAFNPTIFSYVLYNAPKAEVYGLQLTSAFRVTDYDTLSANLAYTHGRYGHFQPYSYLDVDNLQMQYTPDYTATLSYRHHFVLAAGASVDANVSAYLSSAYWGTFNHAAYTQQASYTTTSLSITYNSPKGWNVGIWGTNLENQAIANPILASGWATRPGLTYVQAPREIGVSFGLKM